MKELLSSWMKNHDFWIGILALSIALSSYLISQSNLDASINQARTALYIEFKQRYEKFRNEAPKERKEDGYVAKPGAPGWDYFVGYWHHSFDEWFASTVLLSPEESKLWNEYYGPSIRDALGRKYYRDSICHLLSSGDVSFPAQKDDFHKALVLLYDDETKVPQCLKST